MNVKLITVCSDVAHAQKLTHSLDKFNWPYQVIVTEWKGFGTKLLSVYQYLNNNPDVDGIFFCDAYDVVVLGTMEEALSKIDPTIIIFSTEKACWPDISLEVYYNTFKSTPWQYLNSGLYFAPRQLFLDLFQYSMPNYTTDDQLWATKQYLFNPDSKIILDFKCGIFQSYSFVADDDFSYENSRVQNLKMRTEPVFIHFNGRTDGTKVIELL